MYALFQVIAANFTNNITLGHECWGAGDQRRQRNHRGDRETPEETEKPQRRQRNHRGDRETTEETEKPQRRQRNHRGDRETTEERTEEGRSGKENIEP